MNRNLLVAEGDQEVAIVREEIHFNNLAKSFLSDKIKVCLLPFCAHVCTCRFDCIFIAAVLTLTCVSVCMTACVLLYAYFFVCLREYHHRKSAGTQWRST